MTDQTPHSDTSAESSLREGEASRRGFVKRAVAGVIGAVLALVPIVSGLLVFLDPLRRKGNAGGEEGGDEEFVKVATLDSLPEDGTPQSFQVTEDRRDAWTVFEDRPVGSVYVRRVGDQQVVAFNTTCPHLGCSVNYKASRKEYYCPCHNSTFALDGTRDPESPSPRGLDSLQVQIRNDNEIWVKFQKFRPGTAEKIPVA